MKDAISDDQETVKVNSSLQHESMKTQIQEDDKIVEDQTNEKSTQVQELDTPIKENSAQLHKENIELSLNSFNDITNSRTDKEILVDGTENIASPKGNTLIVLPQEINSIVSQENSSEEKNISEIKSTEEMSDEEKPCELTSVIEISEDGTWDTAKLPTDNVEKIKTVQTNDNQNVSQDFLTSFFIGADLSKKQASAHGAQYYINSGVERVKITNQEKDLGLGENNSEKARNIGAQIMEKYDEEKQKIKHSKNLPDVSLLDVEESLEEIERERRKIIESQAVRAKRIDSWIKGGSVVPRRELENLDLMDNQKDETQQCIDETDLDHEWSQNQLVAQLMNYTSDGEVVYDSILENKQKTKTFWEQLMLAANLSSDAPQTLPSKTDHHVHTHVHIVDEKSQSDASDQVFYDAQHYSAECASPDVGEGKDSPKIVEVSKKMVGFTEGTIGSQNLTDDNVFQSENKVHPEKEFGLGEDREQSIHQKLKSQAESMIVLEMREMKEREDEWRRNQMAFQTSLSSIGTASTFKEDEAFISIPTTDEGNYSEYGSEEKEEPSLNGLNRMQSPEVFVNQNVSSMGCQHHRTQSLDSMSSGHSSGSGSVAQLEQLPIINRSSRTGNTVKPLDEPEDDDISTFIWREKETPIEREIRLACEREEELRREKMSVSLPFKETPLLTSLKEPSIPGDGKSPVETPKRLATKRIENEIEQAKKREKELKKGHIEEEIQPNIEKLKISNATHSDIKITSFKNGGTSLRENKSTAVPGKVINLSITTPLPPEPKEVAKNVQNKLYTSNNSVEALPKRFQPNPHQKGLMKRFLASRGKLNTGFTFSVNHAEPSRIPVAPTQHPITTDTFFATKVSGEKTENTMLGSRPGYTSAEDKIQFELMEMRKREEELRRERARLMARSQPDLLSLVDDEDNRDTKAEEGFHQDNENPNKLPPMAKLRSALSNPSLLDIDNKQPSEKTQRKQKRRSALIEEWEDRIQKSHNNE